MNQNLNINLQVGTILGIVFIILKLTGTINWSWWWVLAPFWIPLAIFIILLPIIVFFLFRR